MSRESREHLLSALMDEVRGSQRATDLVDDAVAEILGINRTDGRCLDIIDQRGRVSAGQLAEESRLSTGAVTAVIDRLQRRGLVRRVPDSADRRRVLVELTDEARQEIWRLMGPLGDRGRPHIEQLSDEELKLAVDFLRMSRQIQEEHAEWLREQLAQGDERSA